MAARRPPTTSAVSSPGNARRASSGAPSAVVAGHAVVVVAGHAVLAGHEEPGQALHRLVGGWTTSKPRRLSWWL